MGAALLAGDGAAGVGSRGLRKGRRGPRRDVRAAFQDVLDGAFDDQGDLARTAVRRAYDGGRKAAGGVEGEGVDAGGVVGGGAVFLVGVEYRLVEGVGGGQLGELKGPQGVDGGPVEHVRVGGAVRAHGAVDGGAVLGEGARLVDAQDVGRAEVVQGGQPPDDDLAAAREPGGAARQRRRDDDGQHLRREPDRDRDGERQRLHSAPPHQRVDQQHQRGGEQHEPDEGPGDAVHRAVEGGRGPMPAAGVRTGEDRVRAGGDDERRAAAGGDAAALEAQMGLVEGDRVRGPRHRRRGARTS